MEVGEKEVAFRLHDSGREGAAVVARAQPT